MKQMPSCRAAHIWKALLVLLTIRVPLHAQSHFGLLSRIPNLSANGHTGGGLGQDSRDTPVDPDNSPRPGATTESPASAPGGRGEDLKPEYAVDSEWLCPRPAHRDAWTGSQRRSSTCDSSQPGVAKLNDDVGGDSKSSSDAIVRSQTRPDFDRDVYYRNKLEFAFDGGWLPINIPFVFDAFLGDAYTMTPLRYTLVPLVASLRWHIDDVGGPWIFRGNWDMTVSGSITLIPRGPETRYFSYDMGIRRNFVPRRGKIAPYFDGRLGLGEINAKEPLGVQFAQGQNFTFTMNLGSGVRYNFNPRYSASVGLNWMHISNLYLSQPAFSNYGINVYGPMFGIDVRLGRGRHGSE